MSLLDERDREGERPPDRDSISGKFVDAAEGNPRIFRTMVSTAMSAARTSIIVPKTMAAKRDRWFTAGFPRLPLCDQRPRIGPTVARHSSSQLGFTALHCCAQTGSDVSVSARRTVSRSSS
jgi:hypothetical protein